MGLEIKNKFDIINLVVQYSSYIAYYKGGAKNPLKGISMKFLVYARIAKFVCIQGVKKLGDHIMAYMAKSSFRGDLRIFSR